ncbi:MAG: tfuA domain protein [Alphaproteobacteria bacterium]|nr:tfuA domain protein [Alphaproteobacteria bacterium]MBF0391132.1 tfuA domain protein [Alphaproteobacteria bacterium]
MVFMGPSLPRSAAATLLEADFQPPARRGDIHRAIRAGARCVVLIDGEFHGCPSVWPREIVDALADGVAVHGASSMGALRAAELHTLGMTGHGRIFEWYRDGLIEADDEVALIYGPAELGWPALSEPLVNIRATLEAAVAQSEPDALTPAEASAALEMARAMPFPRRGAAALVNEIGCPRLARWLTTRRVDRKRLDAELALRAIARMSSASHGGAALPQVGRDADWAPFRLSAALGLDRPEDLAPSLVARHHGLDEAALPELYRRLSARFWRERASAEGEMDVAAWLAHQGISHPDRTGDALVDWVVDAGPPHFGYGKWCFEVELDGWLRGTRT